MNDEKETYVGPVEQVIIARIEITGKNIGAIKKQVSGINVSERIQDEDIANLNGCVRYLAEEIDKLAKSIR